MTGGLIKCKRAVYSGRGHSEDDLWMVENPAIILNLIFHIFQLVTMIVAERPIYLNVFKFYLYFPPVIDILEDKKVAALWY